MYINQLNPAIARASLKALLHAREDFELNNSQALCVEFDELIEAIASAYCSAIYGQRRAREEKSSPSVVEKQGRELTDDEIPF